MGMGTEMGCLRTVLGEPGGTCLVSFLFMPPFPPCLLVLRIFTLFFLLPAAPVENSQLDRQWSPVA